MTALPCARAVLGVVVGCALVMATGCGVPASDTPERIPTQDVPYGLLDPTLDAAPTSSSAVVPTPGTGPQVFFIDGDQRLHSTSLAVTGMSSTTALERAMSTLVEGPDAQGRRVGLATAFGQDTSIRVVSVSGGLARIQLRLGERPPGPDALPLAVGQIVLTATSLDGVSEVLFLQDGASMPAPLPGGELAERPVNAADYASLRVVDPN